MPLGTAFVDVGNMEIKPRVLGIPFGATENGFAGVADCYFREKQIENRIEKDREPQGRVKQEGLILPDIVNANKRTYDHNAEAQVSVKVLLDVKRSLATGRTTIKDIGLSNFVGECNPNHVAAIGAARLRIVVRFGVERYL